MKQLSAIIRPFKLDDVCEALAGIGIQVSEERLDDALVAMIRGARAGKTGDGRIFVTEVSEVIRLCTGEMEEDACNPPFYGGLSTS